MRRGGVEVSLNGERSSMWLDFPFTVRTGQEPARRSEASPEQGRLTPIRFVIPRSMLQSSRRSSPADVEHAAGRERSPGAAGKEDGGFGPVVLSVRPEAVPSSVPRTA
jgi:hypothetical protein